MLNTASQMSGNAKIDQPRKAGQVETSMSELRSASEMALKAICALRERLVSVLNPSPEKESVPTPRPVLVGLAADISAQTDAVNAVCALIEATIRELEL